LHYGIKNKQGEMSMTSATLDKKQDCAVVIGVGASQGIGAAVCRLFAKEGLKVYVAGRTFQKIEAVAAEIHANAGEAVAFRLDAEDINQVQALFDTITSQNERITAVIHNVGEYSFHLFTQSIVVFYSNVAIHFLSAI
jgi:short-subunit dehydrogenase